MKSQKIAIPALRACVVATVAGMALAAGMAHAQDSKMTFSGKLLLTGGVTTIEGAAGGGIVPWAVIGGNGTKEQIGASAFYTNVHARDYTLNTGGALIGIYDRVELSFAQQKFDTREVGGLLGLGNNYKFNQKVYGAKVRVVGDAVLEQDSWLPQIAVGFQRKENNRGELLTALGIKHDKGSDFYVAATKLFLGQSLLVNGTVRFTKANQTGILGFGTTEKDKYEAMPEVSVAYLLRKDLALGAEFRKKPDNLPFPENNWYDVFVAYAPTKNVSLTLAYADLGNIVIKDKQKATYVSVQIGF